MYGKHTRKGSMHLAFRILLLCLLAVVFSVSSLGNVMANTVSAVVIDGNQSYTFSMNSTDLQELLRQAGELGLEPLGPLDVAEQVDNTTTVNIRRGMSVTVAEAGKRTNLVAYRGDTVGRLLEDNNIIVKDDDQVVPGLDTEVTAGLSIEIRRLCQVTVTADGDSRQFSMTGGTVADALREAGVTLKQRDSANYELDEPLFDKMHIRVSRTVRIRVTADGATGEYEVSGVTVQAALKKCGIELSEYDRLNVERKAHPTDGMHIKVTRVTTEETEETEAVEYSTEIESTDELYEDEIQIQTPGEQGEKIVTYRLFYVEGQLESKEAVSEEITKEPVTEVVLKGTKPRENTLVSGGDNSSASSDSTITDASGNELSYSQKLIGTCTAYYPINPTTADGSTAGRGCIAVNPNIIPYGTRMYVTSPDGSIVYGYGVACDTGGAAMAGDILADLCYDTEAECSIIGRRDMVIYILS